MDLSLIANQDDTSMNVSSEVTRHCRASALAGCLKLQLLYVELRLKGKVVLDVVAPVK